MCGRFQVMGAAVSEQVRADFGLDFTPQDSLDLRPSQLVSTLTVNRGTIVQLDAKWGIKPAWAKQLLINAQAETVAEKKTFSQSFALRRCVVPCSGWYEWRDEGAARKQRYLFASADDRTMYMAGIWFQLDDLPQLVTLTTAPNAKCAHYHHRMPLLILPANVRSWLLDDAARLGPLMTAVDDELISIEKLAA